MRYFQQPGLWLAAVILGGILAGCSLLQPAPSPTTAPVLTSEPAATASPEATRTPSPTPFQPILPTLDQPKISPTVPSLFPTLAPAQSCPGGACLATSAPTSAVPTSAPLEVESAGIPLSANRIVHPGVLSKIVSPLSLEAQVILGESGVVRIELLGEDGRFISRQVLNYGIAPGVRVFIATQLEFELPTVSETARLQIITEDQAGRTQSLSSVDVVLLALGETELTPAGSTQEPLVIISPYEGQVATGGSLGVGGVARLENDSPLYVDLTTTDGQVVGSRQVQPDPPDDSGYASYQVEVPYTIQKAAWVRLAVHQAGSTLPGDSILRSVLVYLEP